MCPLTLHVSSYPTLTLAPLYLMMGNLRVPQTLSVRPYRILSSRTPRLWLALRGPFTDLPIKKLFDLR